MKTRKRSMRRIVLFDLDDTLYPELGFVRSGFREVAGYLSEILSEKGRGNFSQKEIYKRLIDLFEEDHRRVFNRLLEDMDIPYTSGRDKEEDPAAVDISELIRLYREHKPLIEPYPECLKTLFRLKDMGCRLGVISDGLPVAQRNKLISLFKGKRLFDKIILTDELGKEYHKPDERSFIMMKEFFNAEWEDMAFVGDNPKKDFFIRERYPILTIRVLKEDGVYRNSDYLEEVREKFLVHSLLEIPDIVLRA